MNSLVAIIAGLIGGIAGFSPLYFVRKSIAPVYSERAFAFGLLSIGASLIIMLVALLVCYKLAPALLIPFGASLALSFLLYVTVFVIRTQRAGR